MFTISSPNLDAAIRRLEKFNDDKLRRAIRSAIERTLRGAKQDAGSKVKSRYTINASHVIDTIRLKNSGLSGEMTSKGGRNKLSLFSLRPKTRPRRMPAGGVFVQNVKGQGGYIRQAFLQKNGEPYARVSTSRYPIRRFTGPAAPQMLGNKIVAPYIVAHMRERLEINLMHELNAVAGGFI